MNTIVFFSPCNSSRSNFPAKNMKSMKNLICINLHFLLLPLPYISATLSLVRVVGMTSHSYVFLCNWIQVCTARTVVRKSKWRASIKGWNGLILEHLDKKMELLGYLKVTVPLGINRVKFDRALQSQTGSVFAWEKQQPYKKYFLDSKIVPVFSFWKVPVTEVDSREACKMVVDLAVWI